MVAKNRAPQQVVDKDGLVAIGNTENKNTEKKPKKVPSPAQLEALRKGREKRSQNILNKISKK